ncbi:MAG: hypothetical protein QOK39_1454, partial [Acidimicrobiaceae bacterium]|nr:hypothetical protein [Acidimicrobiaceae bacterium]
MDPQGAVVDALLALLDDVAAACADADRGDLGKRMAARRARIADPFVAVVVAGEYKTGKSSLVNVLVGADLCPVDEDIATAVPTIVRYASETTISVRRASPEEIGSDASVPPDSEVVAVGDLAKYVSDRPASTPGPDEPPGGAVQAVIV